MPSILSRVGRVFATKKLDHGDQHKPPAIAIPPPGTEHPTILTSSDDPPESAPLGETFVAVSPTVSPSAAAFTETAQQPKESLTATFAALLRSRSPSRHPPTSPIPNGRKRSTEAPLLSLNLDESAPTQLRDQQAERSLGVVFENGLPMDADGRAIVDVNAILRRRLDPAETLALLKATSTLIKERGLETLGIFKPNWHSSSFPSQQVIISLFLATLSPSDASVAPSLQERFDSELQYSQSPHDIAAVFRWGLRHLQLNGKAFGVVSASDDQWSWYRAFAESERSASHPPNAFSSLLIPNLPEAHADILRIVLDVTAGIAAHVDTTAISGSKLAKVLAWWLVSSRIVPKDGKNWLSFYSEWETSARILEHLFLAFVRDQATSTKLPKRLSELVQKYPYAKYATPEDGFLFAKPRFTTHTFDAIFIQLKKERRRDRPTRQADLMALVEEALELEHDADLESNADAVDVWHALKKAAFPAEDTSMDNEIVAEGDKRDAVTKARIALEEILADESLQLLSLTASHSHQMSSPGTSPSNVYEFPLMPPSAIRRRSLSFNDSLPDSPTSDHKPSISTVLDHTRTSTSVSTAPSPLFVSGTDWQVFASGGFGESSVGDLSLTSAYLNGPSTSGLKTSTTAATSPPPSAWVVRRKSTRKKSPSPGSPRRASMDSPAPTPGPSSAREVDAPYRPAPTTIAAPSIVQIDEAFIDVWTDTLTDPVMVKDWPTFVICRLKNPLPRPSSDSNALGSSTSSPPRLVEWLIVEQVLFRPASRTDDGPSSPSQTSFGGSKRHGSFMGRKSSRFHSFINSLKSGSTTASSIIHVNASGSPTPAASTNGAALTRAVSNESAGSAMGRLTRKLSNRMLHGHSHPQPQISEVGELVEEAQASKTDLSPVVERKEETLGFDGKPQNGHAKGASIPAVGEASGSGAAPVTVEAVGTPAEAPIPTVVVSAPSQKEIKEVAGVTEAPAIHENGAISQTEVKPSESPAAVAEEQVAVPVSPTRSDSFGAVVNSFPVPPQAAPIAAAKEEAIPTAVPEPVAESLVDAPALTNGISAAVAAPAETKFEDQPLVAAKAEAEKAHLEQEEQVRLAKEEEERLVKEEQIRAEAEARAAAEAAQLEAERVQKEEEAKRAAEKAEQDRLAALAAEQAEKERLAAEEAENQRLAAEESERQRLAAAKAEEERLAAEKLEMERLEAERIAKERAEAEAKAAEEARLKKEEEERLEQEQQAQRAKEEEARRVEEERIRKEVTERARLEEEERLRKEEEARLESERVAKEAAEAEAARLAAEAEAARVAEEQRLAAKVEAERLEAERTAKDKAEAEAKAAEEARVLAEQQRLKLEEEARLRKEEEERLQREEEERKAEEARLLEEQRLKQEEEERLRQAEVERLQKEEEARLEAERIAKEKAEAEAARAAAEAEAVRIAAEKAEQERLAAEKAEQERLHAERVEAERLAAEKAEQERLAAEQAEKERLAAEQAEKERVATELAEKERIVAEQAEKERLAAEVEAARLAEDERRRLEEQAEAERVARELAEAKAKAEEEARILAEQQRLEAERLEAARLEAERIEAERIEAERIEAERIEAERVEAARLEAERLEAERLEAARLEAARIEAERVEAERLAREKAEEAAAAEAKRLEEERIAAEKAEQERLEAERIAKEAAEAARLEEERVAREKAEAEERARQEEARIAAEKAEAERLAKEKEEAERAEQQRLAQLKAEEEEKARLAAEAEAKAAAEKAERERLEAERLAKEAAKAEAARLEEERLAREKAEAEERARQEEARIAAEKAEAERIAKEKEEAERAEQQRLAQIKAEEEEKARLAAEAEGKAAAEKAERERLAAEEAARAEAERLEKERLEKERLEAEAAEAARREAEERLAREKAEQEAKEKTEREAKEKAEQEALAKAKAEQEAREKAEQEAKEQAEREAKEKAEREAAEQAAEQARLDREAQAQAVKAEQEAQERAALEAREALEKADKEAKDKAESDALAAPTPELNGEHVAAKADDKAPSRPASPTPAA